MSTNSLQYQRQWETKRRNGTDVAWNKGKTKEDYPQLSKSGVKKGNKPWNTGLHVNLNPEGGFKKGDVSWNKGNVGYRKGIRRTPVGFKHTAETKEKMGTAHFGEKAYQWKGGKPKCIDCGKLLKHYRSKHCSDCYHKGITHEEGIRRWAKGFETRKSFTGPTSIERKLYQELKDRGLLFETQKLINGHFLVDAYVPSLNLVIEADGDYWHSLDKSVKQDKAKNAYLTKCGFGLLRISETNINNGSFKNILSEVIN